MVYILEIISLADFRHLGLLCGCGVSACTVGTSFIFTKKSNVAKRFFDIYNAEMAQSLSSLQKSKFHVKKMNNWCELDVRVISVSYTHLTLPTNREV